VLVGRLIKRKYNVITHCTAGFVSLNKPSNRDKGVSSEYIDLYVIINVGC
jgi:hypothetical protein